MSKIAVIDIGSNSVRMVIFDAMARAPHYIFNEKAMCRLGEGLGETGLLSPEGVERAKSELQRFVFIAQALNVSSLEITATAAVREATDGPDFTRWVKAQLGQKVKVLSGEEEAKLSAKGVLLGWPDANGIVSDMGGSSMELIAINKGKVGKGFSTRLGPLRLEMIDPSKRQNVINREISEALEQIKTDDKLLYLVGGSWRAFARCDMARKSYPFAILHEYTMSHKDVQKTIKFIHDHNVSELNTLTGTSTQRLELLPGAAQVLQALVNAVEPKSIAISSYGLREGLLYNNMPSWMRASDPLIAAAENMEKEFARVPGYGRKLFDWLSPLLRGLKPSEERISLAACLLHDTNWRFHPDFRAQIGFEVVAQANICGVTHAERIFLALSLAARYENNPVYADTHRATALLTQEQKEAAWSLGRAMRLGAMLSASVPELLDFMKLEEQENALVLLIDSQYRELYGESVEKRLESLGKVMGRDVRIEFSDE